MWCILTRSNFKRKRALKKKTLARVRVVNAGISVRGTRTSELEKRTARRYASVCVYRSPDRDDYSRARSTCVRAFDRPTRGGRNAMATEKRSHGDQNRTSRISSIVMGNHLRFVAMCPCAATVSSTVLYRHRYIFINACVSSYVCLYAWRSCTRARRRQDPLAVLG